MRGTEPRSFAALAALGLALAVRAGETEPPKEVQAQPKALIEMRPAEDLSRVPEKWRQDLKRKMGELEVASHKLAGMLLRGDAKGAVDSANDIVSSYRVTDDYPPEFLGVFEALVPDGYNRLDGEMREAAGSLASAAGSAKLEEALTHYGAMLNACLRCHAEYARDSMPGFAPKP